MLIKIVLLTATLCLFTPSFAQMKIGNNPLSLNSASLLELESTGRGFVLPRLSISSITSTSPLPTGALNGTIVFNTNNLLSNSPGTGVYYWDSINVKWLPLTPIQATGTTNYVAKWTSATNLGASTILYDNGSHIGLSTITPLSSFDVAGNVAIGSYAGSNAAPSNGLIVSGRVGIGTSSPTSGTKLDVNGNFKFGTVGTVAKNIVSFTNAVNISVPAQFNLVTIGVVTVLALNSGTNYAETTVTLPSALSGSVGTVIVTPDSDLPTGVSIAFARLISATQLKIRFVNANTSAQTFNGNVYISILEY